MSVRYVLALALFALLLSVSPAVQGLLASTGSASHVQDGQLEPPEAPASSPSVEASAPTWPESSQQVPQPADPPSSLNFLLKSAGQGADAPNEETRFSYRIPLSGSSPSFWDDPPSSPTVAVAEVDGERFISISPGPEDRVNVIVQLKDEPVAVKKARTAVVQVSQGAVHARQVVRDHQQKVLETQASVIASMAEGGLSFAMKQYYSFNGVAGSVKAKDIPALTQLAQVQKVYRDYEVHVTLDDSVPLIGAPNVWQLDDSQGQSVTGKGTVVAIIDTGVDYTHPDLGGCLGPSCRVIGGYDFVNITTPIPWMTWAMAPTWPASRAEPARA